MSSDDKVVGRQDDLPLNAVLGSDLALSISDALRDDDPLVWVNGAFTRLTGYPAEEILGRNCRFLQGADTDPVAVARIRTALDQQRAVATVIRNYRRDGTPFWNQVVISPVVDEAGRVTHHIGIQVDVTDRVESERARDLEIDVPHQATARLDLLARISDELAQHLEYDDAVDALGDIAVPALATWGFVAVTDDRGRFDRIHLVVADPDDRETARALANEDISWLSRRAQDHRGAHQRPGLRRDAVRDRRGRPARPDDARAARPAAPARPGQRDGGPAARARPRPRRADPRGRRRVHGRRGGHGRAPGTPRGPGARQRPAVPRRADRRADPAAQPAARDPARSPGSTSPPRTSRPAAAPRWVATGSTCSRCRTVPSAWPSGTSSGTTCAPPPRWASSGRCCGRTRGRAPRPGEVLGRADELVRGLDIADIATCAYLRWRSTDDGAHVTYARAGHPPPLLRLAGGEVRPLDGGLSTPIGLDGSGRAEATVDVPVGATLVLYTDGLVERRDRGLRDGIAALTAELGGGSRRRRRGGRPGPAGRDVHRHPPGGRRVPARGQARAAHHVSSSSRAASGPSGPRSIRSSSRCL